MAIRVIIAVMLFVNLIWGCNFLLNSLVPPCLKGEVPTNTLSTKR